MLRRKSRGVWFNGVGGELVSGSLHDVIVVGEILPDSIIVSNTHTHTHTQYKRQEMLCNSHARQNPPLARLAQPLQHISYYTYSFNCVLGQERFTEKVLLPQTVPCAHHMHTTYSIACKRLPDHAYHRLTSLL